MIRVFSCGTVPLMDIIELQGKLHLQPREGSAAEITKKARKAEKEEEGLKEKEEKEVDDGVVLLGEVQPDRLRAAGCALRMGTLRVDGTRVKAGKAVLVLKRCDTASGEGFPARIRRRLRHEAKQRAAEEKKGSREEDPAGANNDTVLFSEWIDAHPEYLSLDYLFFAEGQACGGGARGKAEKRSREDDSTDERASNADDVDGEDAGFFKDYEVVGLVEDHVIFNGKPARIFA
ncbi:unnamed protein product [Phytomonas sp. EM1]|nr:unnamed protein product [Phytomonas sp. EM1]|eukprot:CCW61093.1 unnamed protein product [Phytomonas sp. isolate EM1]